MLSSSTHQLHLEIPLTSAMGVEVIQASAQATRLRAPLKANSNHQGTAFGGSIHSLAVLSCWVLVNETLKAEALSCEYIVIQSSEIQYALPITTDFEASAVWAPEEKQRFLKMLQHKGLARAHLKAEVLSQGQVAATFTGQFVAQIVRP